MQDLRDAARSVRGSPGAFSVGLLSLGPAIGATRWHLSRLCRAASALLAPAATLVGLVLASG